MDRDEAARLLGVARGASGRQVRSAFRKRVKSDHPDRNRASNVDFQRLVAARDVLLEPEPEPLIAPKPLPEERRRPVRPPTTITYGYDPSKSSDHEDMISRMPPPPKARSKKAADPITRIRRLGWKILAMGAMVVLFFQLVVSGLIWGAATCVGQSGSAAIEVSCTDASTREIVRKVSVGDRCEGLEERLQVGDEIWCVVPR